MDDATSGQVFIGDADLTTLGDKELTRIRRDRIGFVFQSFNLVPTLTAIENITLPMDIAGRKPDQQWLDTVISTVGLGDRLTHKPSQLSGGQQQRVACARALAGRPDIVFADEPTGNLDSVAGAEVLGFLRRSVKEFGQTVVMVTHDPDAAGYADRVLFLADGQIVDEMAEPDRGPGAGPDEELRRPAPPPSVHAARCPEMFRATLKSLLAHKLRMGMSAFAIVLGVAFVAGTLVFTDTLNSSFTDLFRQTAPDVTVRPAKAAAAASGGFTGADTRTVPADLVGELAALARGGPGGRQCHRPEHLHHRQGRQGRRSGGGAPGIGGNYNDAPAADGSPIVTITAGRRAQRPRSIRARRKVRCHRRLRGRATRPAGHLRRPADGDRHAGRHRPLRRIGQSRSAPRWR